jgi:hypothetical protein
MSGQGLETMASQDVRQEWYRPAYGAEAREHRAGTLDTGVANVARVYDCLLGGKDNFAADRAAAEAVLREVPHAGVACQQNRGFLGRMVQALASAGIRQFLDIGSGLPAASNVHEIAQRTTRTRVSCTSIVTVSSRVVRTSGKRSTHLSPVTARAVPWPQPAGRSRLPSSRPALASP